MPEAMTRSARRAARAAEPDPTLAPVLADLLRDVPADRARDDRAAVAEFCEWTDRSGTEFAGYEEALAAYEAVVGGTPAAAGLPVVRRLLGALRERGSEAGRGAHGA